MRQQMEVSIHRPTAEWNEASKTSDNVWVTLKERDGDSEVTIFVESREKAERIVKAFNE